MVQRLFVRVLLRAEKVQGDVWRVTHDPTVVAGRPRRNVEEHAGAEFVDRAVIHRRLASQICANGSNQARSDPFQTEGTKDPN
jgi:hypothetical protein